MKRFLFSLIAALGLLAAAPAPVVIAADCPYAERNNCPQYLAWRKRAAEAIIVTGFVLRKCNMAVNARIWLNISGNYRIPSADAAIAEFPEIGRTVRSQFDRDTQKACDLAYDLYGPNASYPVHWAGGIVYYGLLVKRATHGFYGAPR